MSHSEVLVRHEFGKDIIQLKADIYPILLLMFNIFLPLGKFKDLAVNDDTISMEPALCEVMCWTLQGTISACAQLQKDNKSTLPISHSSSKKKPITLQVIAFDLLFWETTGRYNGVHLSTALVKEIRNN